MNTISGRVLACLALSALAACRCDDGVGRVTPADVSVTPTRVEFEATYVGHARQATVTLRNLGGATARGDAVVDAPFSVNPTTVELARGAEQPLTVTFSPVAAGPFTATLRIGELAVALVGEGLSVPVCEASDACHVADFDLETAMCREAPRLDGVDCATSCVTGTCSDGACVGTPRDCGDGDACTLDLCGASGCSHAPVTCAPPTSKCQVARCDADAGCVVEAVDDGVLCGPDDCLASEVDVCLAGACTRKPRPATARCLNRWVSTTVPARMMAGFVFDDARRRALVFGGITSHGEYTTSTWDWDGASWTERLPIELPPPLSGPAMAFDPLRGRTVMLHYDGHWEFDGTAWLKRPIATVPPPRNHAAMTWDSVRQRLLLFGGVSQVLRNDTWEWNGLTWTERVVTPAPPARRNPGVAMDRLRGRVVLFGGGGAAGPHGDTWEWDGLTWTERTPPQSPPARSITAMAWDPGRQRVVLFGGYSDTSTRLDDQWEWDGTTWTQVTPSTKPSARWAHAMATDLAGQRVLLFGGSDVGGDRNDLWAWNGTSWTSLRAPAAPGTRVWSASAWDSSRRRAVLYGGFSTGTDGGDTWQWDADGGWVAAAPATSPPPRLAHAMVFDPVRQRVVMAGGNGPTAAEPWLWDGVTWSQAVATTSPPRRDHPGLAWDAVNARVLLYGGSNRGDTWSWNGADWAAHAPDAGPPARSWPAMTADLARQEVVLFGGRLHATVYDDTWVWNGATWAQRSPAHHPGSREGAAMTYDAARARVLLFGGQNGSDLGDTWEWDGTDWTQRQPVTSPPPSAGTMFFDEVKQRAVYFDGTSTWVFLP